MTRLPILFSFLFFSFLFCFQSTQAQKTQTSPYNRIQYRKFHWQVFRTPTAHFYFPKGYDTLCSILAEAYPVASKRIAKRMGRDIQGIPNIMVYPSLTAAYETNIGSTVPDKVVLPIFIKKGTRVVLAYRGDKELLKANLSEAIARAIWESMFDNNGLEERAKSIAKEPKIPYWLKEGAILYFAHHWRIEEEDALRSAFEKKSYEDWKELTAYYSQLGGAAFFYFLRQQYHPEAPLQTLYQLRSKGSLPRAIRLITKKRLDSVYVQCLQFYQQRFYSETTSLKDASIESNIITSKNDGGDTAVISKAKGILKKTTISPDKKTVGYLTQRNGKRVLWLQDIASGKKAKLHSYALPPWLSHHDADPYPLLQWKENRLIVAVPQKGKIKLLEYATSGNSMGTYTLYGADGVSSITADNDKINSKSIYTLEAYRLGQNALVQYDGRKGNYTVLKRDSTRPRDAQALDDGRLLYTDTATGERRFVLQIGGSNTLLNHWKPYQYHPADRTIRFYRQKKDSLEITTWPVDSWIEASKARQNDTLSPWLIDYRKEEAKRKEEDSVLAAAHNEEPSFLDGVLNPNSDNIKAKKSADSLVALQHYDPKKAKPYVLQLHSAYFSARVNNDYLINRYQPYQVYLGIFKFPNAGALATGGFSDLFENHHINMGYRLPAGSDGSVFLYPLLEYS